MSKTEELMERRVTYTLEMDGELYVVENVPARVDEETGEQFFVPSTVERLHRMILEQAKPTSNLTTGRHAKTVDLRCRGSNSSSNRV